MRKYLFTIRPHHVGRGGKFDSIDETGLQAQVACEAIGQILRADIGKRVYRVGDVVQVENAEQKTLRLWQS